MKDDLVLNNLKLINYTIFKLGLRKNLQDCYDVGLKGLVMARNSYNNRKGCEFGTYAITCIKYELLKYIKSERCNKRKANYNTVSFDTPLFIDKSGNNITLFDVLDNGENLEEDILKQEKIEFLKKIIAILEPNDRFMLEHYFGLWGNEKMNQTEIANALDVKQSYVSYRIKRAMRIIKKIMEDKYENN
jgi:RNA polymerase sigma factor (sigma-70 family)